MGVGTLRYKLVEKSTPGKLPSAEAGVTIIVGRG